MFDYDQIKNRLRSIPLHLRLGVGAFAATLILLLLFGGGSRKPTPPAPQHVAVMPAPASSLQPHEIAAAPKPSPAPAPAPTAITAAAPTTTPATAASSAPPAAVAAAVPTSLSLMLPAQPEPANLVPGTSSRALESAPTRSNYSDSSAAGVAWTPVAETTEKTPISSWSSAPGSILRSIAPTEGRLRNTWSFWIKVPEAGAHTLVLRLAEGPASVEVSIDGGATPIVSAERRACLDCSQPTTAAANVALAAGWHQVAVQLVQKASDAAAAADLYLRGPADQMPAAIIPATPAAKATMAAPAPQVSP